MTSRETTKTGGTRSDTVFYAVLALISAAVLVYGLVSSPTALHKALIALGAASLGAGLARLRWGPRS